MCCLGILEGCGFRLRAAPEVDADYMPIYVEAAPGSKIAAALYTNLGLDSLTTTVDRKAAGLVIRIINEGHSERISAVNSYGKAIGNELHYQVTFEAVGRNLQPIVTSQTINMVRDYVNPDTEVLGKDAEAAMMRQDLEQDVADRIMRRLLLYLQKNKAAAKEGSGAS